MPLVSSGDRTIVIETIRALGRIGDPSALPPLLKFIQASDTEAHVRLEAVSALGSFHSAAGAPGVMDTLLDLEDNLLLFFTGFSRSAGEILRDQNTRTQRSDSEMLRNLHYVKDLGIRSKEALEGGDAT